MKRILLVIFIFLTALVILITSVNIPAVIIRLATHIDLEEEYGITLKYKNVHKGLYSSPFIIDFSKQLLRYSNGTVNVTAINTFTVGNFTKSDTGSLNSVSNFIDPTSKFKDSWFGVYLVIDDENGKGRRFLLHDPNGAPEDLNNIKSESMILIPKLDQKMIVRSTFKGTEQYSWSMYNKFFYFRQRSNFKLLRDTVQDDAMRSWVRVSGEFDTISALTDIKKSNMKLFAFIRGLVGLPDDEVYSYVFPWHSIVIKGSVLSRYFDCNNTGFWAIVYYNGSSFINKNGDEIDTWLNSDIQNIFFQMFKSLEADCFEK